MRAKVVAPTRKGFGQMVIVRMAELAVDGAVEVDYRESGFSWKLTAPASETLEVGRVASQGFEIAGVVGKLEKALALIENAACDAAIIDANLAGVSASPAASALAARRVPFMVMLGYSREQLHAKFPGALFIQKPCRPIRLFRR